LQSALINKEFKANYIVVVFLIGIALLISSSAIIGFLSRTPYVAFPEIGAISWASLALFILVSLLGLYSERLYFTFLVFVILAFPAPVNDFFPGTHLGNPLENGTAIFPFFTHIDIYLLLGVLRATILNRAIRFRPNFLFMFVIGGMALSIGINMFDSRGYHEQLLLLQGTFQLRYLIFIFLLLSTASIFEFRNNILIGFAISIMFLLIEATLNTRMTHAEKLESGSLGNNVYASAVASILVFLILARRKYIHGIVYSFLLTTAIVCSVVTIIGTGARMPIIAFFLVYTIISYYDNIKKRSFGRKVGWAFSLVLLVVFIFVAANYLPKRYNPETLTKKIRVNEFSLDLNEFIKIERSWETNSLITRLELYTTSLKMFGANPVAGIGTGRWNIQKNEYGFREFLLLDSHNGYLSVISQYGILGLPLIYFIYLYPVKHLYRSRNAPSNRNFLFYLAVINFYFCISDLSNSGIYKHQVFALLALGSVCLMHTTWAGKDNYTAGDSVKTSNGS
jgi:O-antigen ligase